MRQICMGPLKEASCCPPQPGQFATSKRAPPLLVEGITQPTSNHRWGLTADQKDELMAANCIAEQYHILRKYSPLYQGLDNSYSDSDNKTALNLNTSWVVDKTPAYYNQLYNIMKKTPGVPFTVTQKDDDAIRSSFAKRTTESKSNRNIRTIETKLKVFHRQLDLARLHFPDRLVVVNYTAFTERPNDVMTSVFSFLGLQWDPDYLTNNNFNRKGSLVGRPATPGFNAKRSDCQDCVSNPYGH